VTKKILVVEDDLLNRMFLSATLEAGGYAVRVVADGAQVVSAAEEFAPDLVTMDINLPNVSGVQLIRTLKAKPEFRDLPIVAITAYVGKGEEAHIRGAGASDYMAKPVRIGPLLASVEALLGEPAESDRLGIERPLSL
jgi:two-component system cell cycle response regulator DivK